MNQPQYLAGAVCGMCIELTGGGTLSGTRTLIIDDRALPIASVCVRSSSV